MANEPMALAPDGTVVVIIPVTVILKAAMD